MTPGESTPKLPLMGEALKAMESGPVSGHDRLKHCSSVPDLIGRHLCSSRCIGGRLTMISRARGYHLNVGKVLVCIP